MGMSSLSPTFSHPSRIVMTMGIHGSASTWVFNVVRELMLMALGPETVATCFAANPVVLLAQPSILGRHLVCKTHGWPNLHVFAYLASAPIIVTVRDPRDCVVSLMERFNSSFSVALGGISRDCQHATACADVGHLTLRYEDRFFEDPKTVRVLADHLDIDVSDTDADEIFDRYRTEAVRTFAASVASLPKEQLEGNGNPLLFDRVTQITRTHIGDGLVGKWRERLDPQQRTETSRPLGPFLTRFGYRAD
jgi:hypothetical protein